MLQINLTMLLIVVAAVTSFKTNFGKGRVASKFSTKTLLMSSAAPGSLAELCEISKEACDAVSPMLLAFYKKIRFAAGDDSTAKLKSDSTFFSIADGIVQYMMINFLFNGDKFKDIVGEEDETKVNIKERPYSVDDLIVPDEFDDLIDSTLTKIQALGKRIHPSAYKDITLFLDPIDGTREFATGQGDKVTILIGYNDAQGVPCAGIMYRPLTEPATYAAGALSEGYKNANLDYAKEPQPKGLLITDGKVSPWLTALIDELKYVKVPSLASGNRAMMLLEGKAGAYIRDTGGFAKWDTSGPEAVVRAFGGTMSKLPEFLVDKSLVSYKHLKSKDNLDFKSGMIQLTLSNAREKGDVRKGLNSIVMDVDKIREYSCLCGLVALDEGNMKNVDAIHKAMMAVQAKYPPLYT